WLLAVLGVGLALAWLVVVASSTVGYLSPVLGDAIKSIGHTIAGEKAPRGIFQGASSTAETTPIGARAVAVLAVVLLAAGLPFGLRQVWRKYRKQPFVILFALAALGFFATLALRLSPQAWETGNRAGEFLFIGLAFVLACASLEALRRWSGSKLTRPLVVAGIALVLVGGAIAGWPWDSQLAQPLRASADGQTIVSPPLGMAEWARERIPHGRFAAATADAGLLLAPGEETAVSGSSPDVEDLLAEESLAGWELPLLQRNRLRYVVADRRAVSSDGLRGYYFSRPGSPAAQLMPKSVVAKFNRLSGVARVYTNGTITVFDLGAGR
ncbi:MAG: rane protein, partial [Solirubrobacterales bacterium]|nr:rane protein [Solirubrobacterales bacterium]